MLTLVLCVWTAVHPNSVARRGVISVLDRVILSYAAFIMPEMLVYFAWSQHYVSVQGAQLWFLE